MPFDAFVALVAGLVAILFGFVFSAAAPIALTVAVDRCRERFPLARARRVATFRSRYPYR